MSSREELLAYWEKWAAILKRSMQCGQPRWTFRRRLKDYRHAQRMIKTIKSCMLVCVLLLVFAGGCQMAKGGLRDIGWSANTLADNITDGEQERK